MADEIYVDPSAGAATRIQVGGVWYERVGPSDEDFSVGFDDIEDQGCDSCGRYQGQVQQMLTDLRAGWDYLRLHAE